MGNRVYSWGGRGTGRGFPKPGWPHRGRDSTSRRPVERGTMGPHGGHCSQRQQRRSGHHARPVYRDPLDPGPYSRPLTAPGPCVDSDHAIPSPSHDGGAMRMW
jgi:hypothetical protein